MIDVRSSVKKINRFNSKEVVVSQVLACWVLKRVRLRAWKEIRGMWKKMNVNYIFTQSLKKGLDIIIIINDL